jgi:hypothetical protein
VVAIKHSTTAAGTNNPNKQVSVTAWNDDHALSGTADTVVGFDADGAAAEISGGTDVSITGGQISSTLRAALAASTGGALVSYIATGAGAVARSVTDKLRERVSVKDYGALGDGVTDDTDAIHAAFAASSKVELPAGTWVADALIVPGDIDITTAGRATKIKQKPGTAANTRLISITGSNVTIGDISVEGQLGQAGDTTGQQNHGIFINATSGDLSNITIGNVKGTNLRGDVVYVGASTGHKVSQVEVGKVYGTNVYRNVVTAAGGCHGVHIQSIDGEQVGLYHFDHEPDAGNGPSSGVRIDYIRGRNVAIVAPDTGSYIEGEHIGHFEYDSTIAASSPDIATDDANVLTFTRPYPFQFRNVKSIELETCNIASAPGPAIYHIYNAGEIDQQFITGRKWRIANCCQSTDSYYIKGGKGGTPHTFIDLGELEITLGATTHYALYGIDDSSIGPIVLTTPNTPAGSAGLITFSDDVKLGPVRHVAGTGGVLIGGSTNRITVNGGNFAGDTLLSFTTDAILIGLVSTATTTNSGSVAHMFGCSLGGTKYSYRYENPSNPVSIDASGNYAGGAANITLTSGGVFNTFDNYQVFSTQVVGARKTGWAVDTGTAKRTANATYTAGATLTFSAAYVQAEHTAVGTRLAAVEAALQNATQTIKALKDDLHATAGHGLIGT